MEEELRNSQNKLERLAYYDVGTGMPNRSMFERDFTEEISENRSGAVIAVEFSNLKSISEIYGFEYADDILKSCAEYILALPCSSQKKVYRFSSDILFISLSGIQREEARQFAQAVLTKFHSPWYLHNNEHHIRVYARSTRTTRRISKPWSAPLLTPFASQRNISAMMPCATPRDLRTPSLTTAW